ncbi:hypothetical protein [Micromonospora sp. NPDC023814]|uniref:hypothetical protein n=1 Tax=Micromonospora sp. NPDC023814 TaxID=3154596 RepID=UPI00340BAA2A
MSAPLDLAGIAAWVSRPGATPAPTAGDPDQYPHTPWHPRVVDGYLPGDLSTDVCDATRDLIELAFAPVLDLREVA